MNKLSIQLELSRKLPFEIYRRAFRSSICDNATGEDCLLISDTSDTVERWQQVHIMRKTIWSNIDIFS